MENQNQNTCVNCRYFSRHYVMLNTSFRRVFCGNCLNNELIKDRRKRVCDGTCDKWESIEIKKEERKAAIKDTLFMMAKHIEEISMILKEDEDMSEH